MQSHTRPGLRPSSLSSDCMPLDLFRGSQDCHTHRLPTRDMSGCARFDEAVQPSPRRTDEPGIQRSFMVHALAVRHRLPGLPAQCIPYEPARSPPCDTPPDHIAHPGRVVDRARAGRADHVIRHRERRRAIVLLRLQGRLRSVLQKEPGSIEVPGAVAALPRDLHQEQTLTAP